MAGPYNKDNFTAGIATKQWKVQNPDNPDEVIQIGLTDSGLVTAKGEKIFALMIAGAGGPNPAMPSTIPQNPPIAVTIVAAALPDNALVSGAVLKAPRTNVAGVWIGGDNTVAVNNGFELTPGEMIPVAAINLNKFWIIGNAADLLQWIGG